MLVSFSFENWMSFRDKVTISAVAGRQVGHIERVPFVEKYKIHILPVLAIYGGNASGKSNIFKALEFAKDLIRKGKEIDEEIDVQPFLLEPEFIERPSRFWFEILVNDKIYGYSFAVTREAVREEKLVEIRPASEKTLYERKGNNRFVVHSKNAGVRAVERMTRKNQLFLTNCMLLNEDEYKGIWEWFRYWLRLISPESVFGHLEDILGDKKSLEYKWVNNMLGELDTNVIRLEEEDVQDPGVRDFVKKLPAYVGFEGGGERYFTHLHNGEISVKRLVFFHKGKGKGEVKFSAAQESDGTKRIMELLPAFFTCRVWSKSKGETGVVHFVDELDRSIHYLVLHKLLEDMLSVCNADSRSQLIFTTHDLLLMDQELLRRDEVLLVERDDSGVSSVIPLNEYKGVRLDKDIRKSYIQGRFGGIPKL